MRGHMAIQGASNLDALCLCLLIFLVHHLNEASILAKMCVAHLINLEGGGGFSPLSPPPPPPPPPYPGSDPAFVHICKITSRHLALSATPEKVMDLLQEPKLVYQDQQRVVGYLQQYMGNMKLEEVCRFLRFPTGSSVCTPNPIIICFNNTVK